MYDVCLFLEGTYPYVSGGVSTWVYQLIQSMPHMAFSAFFLGASRPKIRRFYYPVPDNVTDFHELYILDFLYPKRLFRRVSRAQVDLIRRFIIEAEQGKIALFSEVADLFSPERRKGRLDVADLAYSRLTWEMLIELYSELETPPSILDFFWSWRVIYLTLFSLLSTTVPRARVYHTVSTGYAGLLGVLAKLRYGRPLILTEHGIYNRERRIEIAQAEWIYSESAQSILVREGQVDLIREWWNKFFHFLGLLAYEHADEIVTLSSVNREVEIGEGADPNKIRIIPNGVDSEQFAPNIHYGKRYRVGLVGRVVPIKDVKSFIRASRIIADAIPTIDIVIVGPTDEDEEYFEECTELVENEGLGEIVRFLGQQEIDTIYPTLDVLVLTSRSEGQPLVILEGGLHGVPVVATDVGGCRELLEGREGADRLMGPSGIITGLCNPGETAEAVLRLLQDDLLRQRMGESGRKRVERYYRSDHLIAGYQQLYSQYIEKARWRV